METKALFFVAEKDGELDGFCYWDFDEDGWYDGHVGEDGYNLNDLIVEFESNDWHTIEHYINLNTPKHHGYFPDD